MEPQVFHPNTTPEPGEEMSVPKPNPHQRVADMQPNNLGRPRKPWGKIVLTVLILFGLGVGGWYGYKWYQKNNQDKTALNNQVKELQSKNESLQKDKKAIESPLVPVNDYFNISEFAVKFKPGVDLPDLTYIYDGKDDVKFSTRSLMAVASKTPNDSTACSPGDNPIGHIVRSAKPIEKAAGVFAVKQIDSKYYAIVSANDGPACSQVTGVQDILNKQQKALITAFDTLTSIK